MSSTVHDSTKPVTSCSTTINAVPWSSSEEVVNASDLPVKIEVMSAKMQYLQPSALPPLASYFASFSSSEESSDGISFSSELCLAPLEQSVAVPYVSKTTSERSSQNMDCDSDSNIDDDDDGDEDYYDDDDDDDDDGDDNESIDMLVHAREADPSTVAAREHEFELEAEQTRKELYVENSAITSNGESSRSETTLLEDLST